MSRNWETDRPEDSGDGFIGEPEKTSGREDNSERPSAEPTDNGWDDLSSEDSDDAFDRGQDEEPIRGADAETDAEADAEPDRKGDGEFAGEPNPEDEEEPGAEDGGEDDREDRGPDREDDGEFDEGPDDYPEEDYDEYDYDYDEEDYDDRPASAESHDRAVRSRQKRERAVRLQKFCLIAAAVLCVLLAVVYAAGCIYFTNHFGFHTTLNGTDVSLQNEAEVEEILLDASENYVLTIKGRATVMDTISAEEIDLEPVFDGSIGTLISGQSCLTWPATLFTQTELTSDSTASFDSSALADVISSLAFFDEDNITEAEDACYTVGEDGIEIVAEQNGTTPDLAAFTEVITVALDGFVSEIILDDDCYQNAGITSESEELIQTVERLNTLLSSNEITIFFTEEDSESMDPEDLLLCIVAADGTAVASAAEEETASDSSDSADEDNAAASAADAASDTGKTVVVTDRGTRITLSGVLGTSFTFDASRVSAFIEVLADEVDTYGRDLEFRTTSGDTVTVPGGNYGWLMDRESTAAALTELLNAGGGGNLTVVWTQTAEVFGEDDIGDTYAEVDLDEQKVYLYSEGKLVVETDCVSGLAVDSGRATPDGVFRITYRKSPATLTGEDYESYVTYWMPFYYGVGFHDATWRSSFGGEIYLTNGSHGCVNLPYSAAEEIYGYVYTGMPVIVYGGMDVEDAIEYTGYVPSTSSSSSTAAAEEEEDTAAAEAAAQAELEAQIVEMAEANYVATGMTEEEAAAQVQADLAEQLAAQQAAAAAEAQAAAQAAAAAE